jgi:hypothetical protein
MSKTTFRPCTTCPIPCITTCNATGCTKNKGKAFNGNLTALEKEFMKSDFQKNGCPYCQ